LVDRAARRLQGFRVSLGEVRADRRPGLAFVGALEDAVATDVERVRIVWRDDDGVRPVEALLHLTGADTASGFRPGGDQADLVGAAVVALQGVAAARRGADSADIDDIGIVWAGNDVATLTGTGDEVILPGDGGVVDTAR